MTDVLVEFGRLHYTRPAADARPEQVAAWYEHKARVLGGIAAGGGPQGATFAVLARQAHAHALSLGFASGRGGGS